MNVRTDWGREGARRAASRGDLLVVVDVLSFSTCVVTAVERGGAIVPCPRKEEAPSHAAQLGAEVAVRREEVPHAGRFSLSPPTFLALAPGTTVVLPSPNGAACSQASGGAAAVLSACLLNASAAAAWTMRFCADHRIDATVLACGERWPAPGEDGPLRFALEDYLGAGAVLSHLTGDFTAEALTCAEAFRRSEPRLADLLWDCESGRELRDRGYPEDVRHATHLDLYSAVPLLQSVSQAPRLAYSSPPTPQHQRP